MFMHFIAVENVQVQPKMRLLPCLCLLPSTLSVYSTVLYLGIHPHVHTGYVASSSGIRAD